MPLAKGILRNLSATRGDKLTFGGCDIPGELMGYCDADYAGDLDTRQSTTGFVFLFHGGAVS